MLIEFEPAVLKKELRSHGVSEAAVRAIDAEFAKNNLVLTDEKLADLLSEAGMDLYSIIAAFNKLGIGKETVVRMFERKAKQKLGSLVNIYTLEVDA